MEERSWFSRGRNDSMKSGRRPSEACAGFLSMNVNGPMMRSDRLGTLEEAKGVKE